MPQMHRVEMKHGPCCIMDVAALCNHSVMPGWNVLHLPGQQLHESSIHSNAFSDSTNTSNGASATRELYRPRLGNTSTLKHEQHVQQTHAHLAARHGPCSQQLAPKATMRYMTEPA